ncbi:uncharacterized protein [Miscanthus floridulus]|uniref:uncharacterized protein n=1 Tax=Miscanthus floridulus TaxID=154761 RepID=UPI003457D732
MATPTLPPAAPASTATSSVSRLRPLRPSLPRLRFWPAPVAAAAAAPSPIALGAACRTLPGIRCRAAAGPSPPSSEPPTPSPHGWQERLSSLQDRVRVFFAVLFWMSLFFWGSAWDGSNNSGGKKRQRFRKKSK